MALKDSNKPATGTSRVQTGAPAADTREKAAAFINFDLPTKSGEKKRMVSLALNASDPFHAQLLEYLSDPETREANVAKVTSKLIGSINFAKVGDAAVLDL